MTKLEKLPRLVPEIKQRIHEALVNINAKEAEEHAAEKSGKTIGMGSLGRCPRAIWFDINGFESERPFGPHMLAIFSLGKMIEQHVIKLLIDADFIVQPVDPATCRQFWHEASDPRIRGKSDGKIILEVAGIGWVVLEIKSASGKKFRSLKKLGYEKWNSVYYDTLQLYMGSSELRQALVVVYGKDDSDIHSELIGFDPDHYAKLVEKGTTVLDSDVPVPRPAEAIRKGCSFCFWCNYSERCWDPTGEVKFDD